MFGVQAAVIGVTCLVVVVLLVTSPLWMRVLGAVARALWRQVARTDEDVVISTRPKNVVDGEFREVDE